MAIASAIVQPAKNYLEVAEKIADFTGVTVHTVTPAQIIIVVEADRLEDVENISRNIERLEGVLGLYPTYVTTADE